MTTAENTGEVLVAEVCTLEQANRVRREILERFERVWLFVMLNRETSRYEILAANEWCGKLDQTKLEEIKKTCASVTSAFVETIVELDDSDVIEEDCKATEATAHA